MIEMYKRYMTNEKAEGMFGDVKYNNSFAYRSSIILFNVAQYDFCKTI